MPFLERNGTSVTRGNGISVGIERALPARRRGRRRSRGRRKRRGAFCDCSGAYPTHAACTHICTHVRAHIHTHTHTYKHTCAHTYTHERTHTYTNAHGHTCAHLLIDSEQILFCAAPSAHERPVVL